MALRRASAQPQQPDNEYDEYQEHENSHERELIQLADAPQPLTPHELALLLSPALVSVLLLYRFLPLDIRNGDLDDRAQALARLSNLPSTLVSSQLELALLAGLMDHDGALAPELRALLHKRAQRSLAATTGSADLDDDEDVN